MPIVISENGQTRCRNSYSSSAQCRLSLRCNGEDTAAVITDSGQVIQAGFDAPTATPVATDAGAGNVPDGYYVYRYVYASSSYPFVENAVTGGNGQQWPRSSPSPASNTLHVAGASIVTVTGDYTTRSDVDFIWMYRTSVQTTATLADQQAEAGRFFYVGQIANITSGGSFIYSDNSATDTSEPLELDNYTCPLFRQAVFDGFQWWGWGNRTLTLVVSLDDTDTIQCGVAPHPGSWGDGRNGPPASIAFLGITTGGYDGRGNYYFRALTENTAHVYNSADMITPVVLSATGFTTAYLSAPSTTLYKSKQLNPFSWGITETTFIPNTNPQQTRSVPSLYAEQIGGGVGTAICLIPNERILKLDTEAPERSYALDLNAANSSDFIGTLRTLDEAQSVGSQFTQFAMRNSEGQSFGTGINAKALQLLSGDAQSLIPIGGPVIETLRSMDREGEAATWFHGVYDRNTELNCWWVKTNAAVQGLTDTLIYQHAPTGTWGLKYTPDINASWTVFDNFTEKYYSFTGTIGGLIGAAFYTDYYTDNAQVTAPATFLIAGSENQLTVPIYAQVISIAYDSTGFLATVTTSDSHLLLSGALVQFAATNFISTDYSYSVFNVTTSTFQVRTLAQGFGTDATTCAIVPPIFTVPSVVSAEGYGMFYIQITGNPGGGVFNPGDTSVAYTNATYSLTDLYDHANAGVLPGDGSAAITYNLYIGGIPCFLRRYFTSGTPQKQKQLGESYATALNPNTDTGAFLIKYYQNYNQTAAADRIFGLQVNKNQDNTNSPEWYTKNPPSDLTPSVGVEILEIGTAAFQLMDTTLLQSNA